jgi:hypothetical protein
MNPDTTHPPRWEVKISDEDGITPYLWDDRKSDNYDLGSLCRILNEYEEKTNEVARLRELLKQVIEIADGLVDPFIRITGVPEQQLAKLKTEARLAPTSEEPCDHAEHAEPLTGSYRCRKCDKVFDIVEPTTDEWGLVEASEKMKAEDLIRGLHDGWEKARKAHLKTCENAGREIARLKAIEHNLLLDKHNLHTENVCLQELIQEFYEWSRRDYPTEAEVREIMNRYHDLLNK